MGFKSPFSDFGLLLFASTGFVGPLCNHILKKGFRQCDKLVCRLLKALLRRILPRRHQAKAWYEKKQKVEKPRSRRSAPSVAEAEAAARNVPMGQEGDAAGNFASARVINAQLDHHVVNQSTNIEARLPSIPNQAVDDLIAANLEAMAQQSIQGSTPRAFNGPSNIGPPLREIMSAKPQTTNAVVAMEEGGSSQALVDLTPPGNTAQVRRDKV